MPMSNSDTQNIKLGVCEITYGSDNLGLTKGGVEVEIETTTHKITVDQFGETEVGERITGRRVLVRVPLVESTLDRLAAVTPASTLVMDGQSIKRLDVRHGAGTDLRAGAKVLKLHPIENASSDKSEDFVVPIAVTTGSYSFSFKVDEERVYPIEFFGMPDMATGLLFQIGDTSSS